MTHRRAHLAASGELVIYDNNGNESDRLTAEELAFFLATVHAVAEAVIARDYDDRKLSLTAGFLNELQQRHGFSELANAVDPGAAVGLLIMDLQELGGDRWRMDVARGRKVTSEQAPSFWELELRAGDRVFVGRWEDVPDQYDNFDFHLDAPPPWIDEKLV